MPKAMGPYGDHPDWRRSLTSTALFMGPVRPASRKPHPRSVPLCAIENPCCAKNLPICLPVVHLPVTFVHAAPSQGFHDHRKQHRKDSMTTTSNTAGTNKPDSETSGAATGNTGTNGSTEQRGARTVTIALPFVTATFRRPEINLPRVRIPNRQEMQFAAHTVQSHLPPPQQALYYGGLAAL